MIVYTFNPYGVYESQTEVEGPGWPSNSTPTPPPPKKDGFYAQFQGGIWYEIEGIPPTYPSPEDVAQQNKEMADFLLSTTDWSEIPSVSNTSNQPHLINVEEFISYRCALRKIAVNPPLEPVDFPKKPVEIWS